MKAFISVKNLTKKYGSYTALEGISFEIPQGVVVGVAGPSGSGKSTLLKILAGLSPATSGDIWIQGKNLEEEDQERFIVSVFFKHASLPKHLRVGEYLRLQAKLKGVKAKDLYLHVERFLKQMGLLKDYKHRLIGTLPESILRCVEITGTFIGTPRLVLLDDPMTGLDPEQASRLQELIANQKGKRTILISGQNPSAVERICDYTLVLLQGRLVFTQVPQQVPQQNLPNLD